MKKFRITFKMIDHFADDAGVASCEESTVIEAEDNASAVMVFRSDMESEYFDIIDVEEVV